MTERQQQQQLSNPLLDLFLVQVGMGFTSMPFDILDCIDDKDDEEEKEQKRLRRLLRQQQYQQRRRQMALMNLRLDEEEEEEDEEEEAEKEQHQQQADHEEKEEEEEEEQQQQQADHEEKEEEEDEEEEEEEEDKEEDEEQQQQQQRANHEEKEEEEVEEQQRANHEEEEEEDEEKEQQQAEEQVKHEEDEKYQTIITSRGSFSKPNQLTLSKSRDESKIMNRGILCALRAGDRDSFIERISDDGMLIPNLVDNQGNSPLHLAASLGHYHIVNHIVPQFGYLSKHENSMRETPLHVAARSGNLSIVKSLVSSTDCSLLSAKSKNGDTALHAALKGKHAAVSFYLVDVKHDVSFDQNDDEVSPLYLAVEAGYYKIVRKMLECSCCPSKLASMSSGKSVVHAAMRAKRKDILGIVLSQDAGLVKSRCKEGKTCLSLGASIGFYDGVCYILTGFDKKASHLCYLTDDDGFTPIHMAAKEGHVKILRELLKHCPDSIELLNNKCQNILHVAAESGKSKIVKYILGLDNQKRMVNEQDVDGNTPLHLATKNWHPKVVSMLTWNNEVNLEALNNGGFTALDITEKKLNSGYILRRRLTWMALVSAGAKNGPKPIPLKMLKNKKSEWGYTDKFKDRVNTLMVTATLVATVTFAAGFTLPGGYISSAPDLGMAVLVKTTAFKVFLLCDSIAMLSSMVTIMALIWAQLGDVVLIEKAFLVALPLLATALVSMTVAFMAGVCLVVSHIPWLAYFILALSSVFLLALLLLIIPYVYSYPSQGFLRYIFYFPFILMVYAVSDKDDSSNSND